MKKFLFIFAVFFTISISATYCNTNYFETKHFKNWSISPEGEISTESITKKKSYFNIFLDEEGRVNINISIPDSKIRKNLLNDTFFIDIINSKNLNYRDDNYVSLPISLNAKNYITSVMVSTEETKTSELFIVSENTSIENILEIIRGSSSFVVEIRAMYTGDRSSLYSAEFSGLGFKTAEKALYEE